jgi:SynChlorMet cassette protein ScmD
MELNKKYPIANAMVVFREEFDDWAVLFDPDANKTFGMNPVSSFVWKKLDGKHTLKNILDLLREECDDVPAEAPGHLEAFLLDLEQRGLVGFERF